MPTLDFYTLVEQLEDKRVVLEMDDQIYLDRPDYATIISVATRLNQKATSQNMEFWWLEDKIRPPYAKLTAAFTPPANATDPHTFTFSSDAAPWFEPEGTLFFLGWGAHQQMKVSSVTVSGTNCTVTAYLWPNTQTATSAGAVGSKIVFTYPVYGSLADAPTGSYRESTPVSNYLEQTMRAVTVSKILTKTKLYGGDLRQQEHRKAIQAFLNDQETSILWGIKYKDTSQQNNPEVGVIYRSGGIIPSLTTNVFDMGGASMTYQDFLSKIPLIREYSLPQDLAIFAPTAFMTKLVTWGLERVLMSEDSTTFGMAITKLVTPFGEFPIIYSPLFDYYGAGHILVLNLKTVTRMILGGDDGLIGQPTLYLNQELTTQPNKVLDFYRGIGGVKLTQEVKSGVFVNWT